MLAIARLAVTRPKTVLAVWFAIGGVLAVLGLGLENNLHRDKLDIPGTESFDADKLDQKYFGETSDLLVLLRGPEAELDRQGPRLAQRFESHAGVKVLDPWTAGAGAGLSPAPNEAVLILRSSRPFNEVSRELVPKVRGDVDRLVKGPVTGYVSGYADIASGIHGSSVEAVKKAEIIAAPALLIVLLLVFRSVVAAMLPLFVGFTTIGAGRGVLELINSSSPLDAVSLNLLSMMGLALGVDYALLVVSRLREELAAGVDHQTAALRAVDTAGRTSLFAGAALAAAMGAALFVAPGNLLGSATAGVVVAVALSVIAALSGLPAVISLLGPRIDRWTFGKRRVGESGLAALALRALRRPALAAGVVVLLVAALSAPAFGITTGAPDPRVLPKDTKERTDFEAMRRELGKGWTAPYRVTIASDRGPITDARKLRAIGRWQRGLTRRADVDAVLGAGEIEKRTRELDEVPGQLDRTESSVTRAIRDQERLADGLSEAGAGAEEMRAGLGRAADGAGQLASGAGSAEYGALLLRDGISAAQDGAKRLDDGMREANAGSVSLARGAQRARGGANQLYNGILRIDKRARAGIAPLKQLAAGLGTGATQLEQLRVPAQRAESELDRALSELDNMLPSSKADPRYAEIYRRVATAQGAVTGRNPVDGSKPVQGYDGLDKALAQASTQSRQARNAVRQFIGSVRDLRKGLGQLADGSKRLRRGMVALDGGATRLTDGLKQLTGGSGQLSSGLGRLEGGAGQLVDGVQRLEAGAQELDTGLANGAGRTTQLTEGLDEMLRGVKGAIGRTEELQRGLSGSDRLSDATRSGYFRLAALDRAGPNERKSASFGVNLDSGGGAATIIVIGTGVVTKAGHPLRGAMERSLDDLEQTAGVHTAVGGPAATLQDFESKTASRILPLLLVLMGVTYLVLVPLLRSLVLPLLAVLLNVLAVGAAFGVLVLLFQGDPPLLGGAGYVDSIMTVAIVSVVFGLSIDYEVFLLARMREGYDLTGDTDEALAYGLHHTAGVVTGAAVIMCAVFGAFALSEIVSMRQLGIGLGVAVLLDSTLVRLVLLPASIKLVGASAWWMPAWLDRALPTVRVESAVPAEGYGGSANGSGAGSTTDAEGIRRVT